VDIGKQKKNGKTHYCLVSGGYVLCGIRTLDSKHALQLSDNENSAVENFGTSSIPKFIKQNLGDKVLQEVQDKVNMLIAQRNKKTAAPAKDN